MISSRWQRVVRGVAVAAVASAATACSDSTEPHEHDLDVFSVAITVGASTITIDRASGAPSGPLVVPAGASTVTVVWRRPDGSPEDEVEEHADDFELRIVPLNTSVLSFTTSGAFGGTLTTTGLASGETTTAQVQLYHIEEGHPDFGPYTFTIQIQ